MQACGWLDVEVDAQKAPQLTDVSLAWRRRRGLAGAGRGLVVPSRFIGSRKAAVDERKRVFKDCRGDAGLDGSKQFLDFPLFQSGRLNDYERVVVTFADRSAGHLLNVVLLAQFSNEFPCRGSPAHADSHHSHPGGTHHGSIRLENADPLLDCGPSHGHQGSHYFVFHGQALVEKRHGLLAIVTLEDKPQIQILGPRHPTALLLNKKWGVYTVLVQNPILFGGCGSIVFRIDDVYGHGDVAALSIQFAQGA